MYIVLMIFQLEGIVTKAVVSVRVTTGAGAVFPIFLALPIINRY